MVILELKGNNFSNYDYFEYKVGKGVTLVEGKNKSGKSSLLDLILFAIYGNCKKARKIEFFRKRGSKGPLETYMKFDYKGRVWKISRTYDGKSDAELIVDRVLQAKGFKNVETYLQDNFVSEVLLCNSNLVQQGDNSGLLEVRPTERFNLCKKIFGLNMLKAKAEMVKLDIDEEEKILATTKLEIDAINNIIDDLEKWIGENDKKIIFKSISDSEVAVKELEKNKNTVLEKQAKIMQDINTIQEKNKEIEEHNSKKANWITEIATIEGGISGIEKDIETTQIEYNTLRESLDKKQKDIDTTKKEADSIILVGVRVIDDKPLTGMRNDLVDVQSDIKSKEKDLSLAKAGSCPTCGKPCDHLNTNELETDLKELRSKEGKLNQDIKQLEEAVSLYNKAKDEQTIIREKKLGLENSVERLATEYKGMENLIKKNEEILKIKSKDLDNNKKLLEEKKKSVDKFKVKELIDISQLEKDLSDILTEVSNVESQINDMNNVLNTSKMDLKDYEDKERKMKDNKEQVKEKLGEISKKEKYINDLKKVRHIFEKKLPLYLVIHKLNYITKEANTFLHKTFDKYDISFEQEKDALSINFTDTITNTLSAYENLSGFEAGIGGLSIRVGFAMYNSTFNQDPINWVGLDEVDQSFEEENSELLFKNIFELRNQFQQVLMITHKPNIKEWIQPNDTLMIKNDGKNSYILKD